MRMPKIPFAELTFCAMALFLLPLAGLAQLSYTTNSGALTVVGFTAPAGALAIPDAVNGLPVTGIGASAFAGDTNLTSITIGANVTSLGGYAFQGCTNLNRVYFKGNAPVVGPSVFAGDTNAALYLYYSPGTAGWGPTFDGLLTVNSGLDYATNNGAITIVGYTGSDQKVLIPATINGLPVESIGEMAFYEGIDPQPAYASDTNLTSISIPDSVTGIGQFAFESCGGLTNVTFGKNVNSIAANAFLGCTNLTSITIPASLTGYGLAFAAFWNCYSLTNVYFLGNAPASAGTSQFNNDTNATAYYLPGSTGWGATFDGLPTAPLVAFNYTTNNGAINVTGYAGPGDALYIPDTLNGLPVSSIVTNAFLRGTNLTSVTIGNNVTNIGSGAFANSTRLASITFGANVTNIATGAFYYCQNLSQISFQGNAPGLGSDVFVGDFNAMVYYLPGTTGWSNTFGGLPAVELSQFSYTNSNGTNIITGYAGPAGPVTIPAAFQGVPVTCIGANAFSNSSNLTSFTIPGSVSSLGDNAFGNCSNLSRVWFQGNAPGTVGTNIFSGDTNATIYYLPGATGWGTALGGAPVWPLYPFLFTTNEGTISITGYIGAGGPVSLPDTIFGLPVTSIGNDNDWVFDGYTSLTSFYTGTNAVSIGMFDFAGCTNLGFVTIGTNVNSIGDDAFANCYNLTMVTMQGNAPVAGGPSIFLGDTNAAVYYLPNTTGWGTTFAGIPAYEIYPFDFSTANGVVTITGYTGSSSVVTIPDTINGLPVTSITSDLFDGFGVSSVTIGINVTNIGNGAFYNCANLTGVYFKGNAPAIGSLEFTGDSKATVYYLPGATGWSASFGGLPTAIWQPQLQSANGTLDAQENAFGFTVSWASGMTVIVEGSTNLVNPAWLPLQTNTLAGDITNFTDPQWTNHSRQYYRVRTP